MTELRIGPNLALPPEAVTQTFAILAKRGVGKTYLALVLVEEMLKASLRVVVADPVGVAWGLRSSADGKKPGLPIVVLGGDHGDLPLNPGAGDLVANLIVDERVSAVLDLSHFRKGEMRRFMTAFAETVYHRNREPLHLVLDEADEFAPQQTGKGGDVMPLLGAIEDLVRRGRARGIGVTLITQRPAVLNKDVLTQIETLVVLRLIAPQDRTAIDEWVKVHGTPEQRDELMRSLPSLPIGAAWFWSPGWLDLFRRVQVRHRETFDSSATPRVGQSVKAPRTLADVDLAKLQERMAATVEQAKASDPKLLQGRIRELERQLAQRPTETRTVEVERIVEVPVPLLTTQQLASLTATADVLSEAADRLRALRQDLETQRAEAKPSERATTPPVQRIARVPNDHKRPPPFRPVERPAAAESEDSISTPQQRILDALASFEALGLADMDKSNVAVFADQSPRSSGFANNLGRLRSMGMIDYPSGGRVALTDAGRACAAVTEPISSLDELHAAWFRKLPAPQVRILRALIDAYPGSVDRTELASRAEQSPTSSGYANNLGALRGLGLLDYLPGRMVVATDLLFPAGLSASAGGR